MDAKKCEECAIVHFLSFFLEFFVGPRVFPKCLPEVYNKYLAHFVSVLLCFPKKADFLPAGCDCCFVVQHLRIIHVPGLLNGTIFLFLRSPKVASSLSSPQGPMSFSISWCSAAITHGA